MRVNEKHTDHRIHHLWLTTVDHHKMTCHWAVDRENYILHDKCNSRSCLLLPAMYRQMKSPSLVREDNGCLCKY